MFATSKLTMSAIPAQDNLTATTVSAQQTDRRRRPRAHRQCSCCSHDQNSHLKRQRSPNEANLPQKRRRTKLACPAGLSAVVKVQQVPPAGVVPSSPQTSTSNADPLVTKPSATIPDADLPPVSNEAPSPQPSTVPVQHDGPLVIHNRSVEEYQQLYHDVVDDMLRYKNGRVRPYSLELGRRIKQKLWERLNRPTMVTSESEDGCLHVDVTYGLEDCPSVYNVDIRGEPKPKMAKKVKRKK